MNMSIHMNFTKLEEVDEILLLMLLSLQCRREFVSFFVHTFYRNFNSNYCAFVFVL